MSENLIELRHIGKRFGGVRALDDVSFAIKPGEIHCLAGENGSGKSTIIKVMSGVYTPEDGEIVIDGKSVGKLDPVKSVYHGIQVIYQDFSLFGNLTVAENLAINTFLIEGRKGVDWKRVRELAQRRWNGSASASTSMQMWTACRHRASRSWRLRAPSWLTPASSSWMNRPPR